MLNSVNKWPASPNRGEIGIETFTANLQKGPTSVPLAAAVGPALIAMAEWWDQNIEPVTQLGGYNYREIRGYEGSGKLSNHASGTAIDINWDKHPLGARNTVDASKVSALRQRAFELQLKWGGDWTGRADEMHFEVNVPPSVFTLTNLVPTEHGVALVGWGVSAASGVVAAALAYRRWDGTPNAERKAVGVAVAVAGLVGGLYQIFRRS